MSAQPLQVQPITAKVIKRPVFRYAPSFDAWLSLNRRALASYACEIAMAVIDTDDEMCGADTFARIQYDIERAVRGLPLHVEA